MCDTILALPAWTAGHATLFGKNSDRQRNEAQVVEYFPERRHAPATQLRCTYISIPQAERTAAVLLSRPFWIWGAEIGVNEHGVAIGNEAVQARTPAPEKEALIGMDLLRLALERAASAAQAVTVITSLLERYGQGGNCGHRKPSFYNNSFLIADSTEGFVLETVDRDWVLEKVRRIRTISNGYTIGRSPDAMSPGFERLVSSSGWSSELSPDYADVIANKEKQHIGNAEGRQRASTSLLMAHEGKLGLADMMRVLRDHGTGDHSHTEWDPECVTRRTLCLHANIDEGSGQTVGSMICEMGKGQRAVHWVTGTAAPCVSVFKPIIMGIPVPRHGPRPVDRFDPLTLWWGHERLHRTALLEDPGKVIASFSEERDTLERVFSERIQAVVNNSTPEDMVNVVNQCWVEAMAAERRWFQSMPRSKPEETSAWIDSWRNMNKIAGMKEI